MLGKILKKEYLVLLAGIAGVFHTVLCLLFYFMDTSVLQIIDYVLVGSAFAMAIVFFAYRKYPLTLRWDQALLVMYFAWYIISCLSMTVTNGRDWTSYNMQALYDVAVSFFLLFPLGYYLARYPIPSVFRWIIHILLLGWSVFMLFVLLNVFQGNVIPTLNGGYIVLRDQRALQLNCNSNTTGAWEIIFFLGCFFMLLYSRNPLLKILYAISSIINYFVLSLSNSRTSIVSALIGFSLVIGLFIYSHSKRKKTVRLLAACIGAIISGVLFYVLRSFAFTLVKAAGSAEQAAVDSVGTAGAAGASAARSLFDASTATLSHRTEIWNYVIQGITGSFQRFLFGVTPASVVSLISSLSNGTISMYTHNQFLEITVATGVVGLFFFCWWLATVLKNSHQLVFVRKVQSHFLCVPILILVLIVSNMTEAILLYYQYLNGCVFFVLCGFLSGLVFDPEKSKTVSLDKLRRIRFPRS